MSDLVRFIISALLFLIGCTSVILGILGVFRFKFVINRMHCAALLDTTGLLFILLGLCVYSSSLDYIPKLLLILVFQWIASPIASHMVGRMEVETDRHLEEHAHQTQEAEESK